MSELHDTAGGKVLDFDLLRPHEQGRLRCSSCGNVAQHVWPSKTSIASLECVCGKVGTLSYDLPDAPACGHDPSVYQWFKTVGDSDTIDTSQPFCARCALAAAEQKCQQLERERQTCRDHGPHLGCHYCPECYQRAYAAGWEASERTQAQMREALETAIALRERQLYETCPDCEGGPPCKCGVQRHDAMMALLQNAAALLTGEAQPH